MSFITQEAIDLFCQSSASRAPTNEGDAEHQARYRILVIVVKRELDRLKTYEAVNAVSSSSSTLGHTYITFDYDPEADLRTYSTPLNQALLAATSLQLVQAILDHISSSAELSQADLVEEEIIHHTMSYGFFRELKSGLRYRSKVSGNFCTAQLLPLNAALVNVIQGYETWSTHFDNGSLVDHLILRNEGEPGFDASFVRRSIKWWDGLQRRSPATLLRYLSALIDEALGPVTPNAHRLVAIELINEILLSLGHVQLKRQDRRHFKFDQDLTSMREILIAHDLSAAALDVLEQLIGNNRND